MDIRIEKNESVLNVKATGKLDLDSAIEYAPTVAQAIKENGDEIKELILDFSEITFVASYGLRAILELNQLMKENGGSLKIKGASDEIKKSFNLVGFSKLLVLE